VHGDVEADESFIGRLFKNMHAYKDLTRAEQA